MKKTKKIILCLFIILFTIAVVPKEDVIQNDTFFDIAIGNYITENGIDMMEHWTWHTELTYIYSHWLFDIVESLIYNISGFLGIYIWVLIMASITMLTIFSILTKKKYNVYISLIITLITTFLCRHVFVARVQMITFWLFILEYYFIEQMLLTSKKRYCFYLIIIPIIIANIHSGLWILTFLFYLPYIAEFIIYKILNKTKLYKEDSKIIVEEHNIKLLIVTMVISILTGLITPLGDVPFTAMYKSMTGMGTIYVSEMQKLELIEAPELILLISIFVGLIFTKTKYKFVDILFFVGFFLMTLSSVRSAYYLIFIGSFIISNLINECCNEYNIEVDNYAKIIDDNKNVAIFASFLILALTVYFFVDRIPEEYYIASEYPVKICRYIKNNIDIENMRIYNGYNYGSYLEFCGIPAFMDSRCEVYCKEFNDTTILEDVYDAEKGNITYKELFEKYEITHVLIYKSGTLYTYVSEDDNYELLYEEDNFVFYRVKNASY